MTHKDSSIKSTGQVYTPPMLVCRMLDWTGYDGPDIIRRHFIDNSCGDGAFLAEAVNSLIRDARDLRIHRLRPGQGVYSGYYILADDDRLLDAVPDLLDGPGFTSFVRMLRIYKSGGYHEFRARDLEQYLNYAFSITLTDNHAD